MTITAKPGAVFVRAAHAAIESNVAGDGSRSWTCASAGGTTAAAVSSESAHASSARWNGANRLCIERLDGMRGVIGGEPLSFPAERGDERGRERECQDHYHDNPCGRMPEVERPPDADALAHEQRGIVAVDVDHSRNPVAIVVPVHEPGVLLVLLVARLVPGPPDANRDHHHADDANDDRRHDPGERREPR